MADRLMTLLIICLQMYEIVIGDYCQSEDNPSVRFCQNGSISGSNVYINGSSVKTKEDLIDRGCVCYLEQFGNKELIVNALESCMYCGLQVRVGNDYLRSAYYASQVHGWGMILLNDTKVTMTLGLDGSTDSLNTAFCITIQANVPDIPVVLNLTCEDPFSVSNTSSNPSSTGPNLIQTSSPYMIQDTTKSPSPTSALTAKPLTKFETTGTAEVSSRNTTGAQASKTTNPSKVVTLTAAQNNEIIVAAAAGGFGVGVVVVIVIDVIIFVCYKRRIKNKDTHRSSTALPRVYTELEFNSRDGQNNSHVYNSIDRQNTYDNGVQ